MPDALVCHNCFEDATCHGPTGRGDDSITLLRTDDDTAFVFCSEACAEWWFTIVGNTMYHGDRLHIATIEP